MDCHAQTCRKLYWAILPTGHSQKLPVDRHPLRHLIIESDFCRDCYLPSGSGFLRINSENVTQE